MSQALSTIGEFGLIDLLKKKIKISRRVIQGIGDDTAVVSFDSQKYLLLTTDMLTEGVHFTKKMPAFWIGHKALACNLSDIAAMGGWPRYALVSLGIPASLSVDFVKDLYIGMEKLARKFGVSIVGGDTNKSGKIVINVALAGEVKKKDLVLRQGAREGDQIFVTGALGRSFKSGRHLKFMPRLLEARYLVENFKLTSMIDISDGLAADLGHILEASSVGARLWENQIPRRAKAALPDALYDGEDFELIFTLPRAEADRLFKSKNSKFLFYPIGEIVSFQEGLKLITKQGKIVSLKKKGFAHF